MWACTRGGLRVYTQRVSVIAAESENAAPDDDQDTYGERGEHEGLKIEAGAGQHPQQQQQQQQAAATSLLLGSHLWTVHRRLALLYVGFPQVGSPSSTPHDEYFRTLCLESQAVSNLSRGRPAL